MTAATAIPSTAEFRSRLVAWLDENDLTPPPGDHSLDAHHAQHSRVLSALYDAGWMRYGWPESAGGLGGPAILQGRRRRRDRRPRPRRARTVFDARGADADDDRLCAPRSRRGDGAPAVVRPRNLVPGLLRTRLRQRPGVLVHPRRAARRRMGRQRPEGVDQFRAVRDAVRPAHPHRGAGNPQPRSDHRILRRSRYAGHHSPAAAHHARS